MTATPWPLMTSEPGSFARATIVKRKPQIIAQVIADNAYPPEILRALADFRVELASGVIQPLHEEASDVVLWNDALAPFAGKTWLEVPWYFAETYFYRRLLEAARYLQPGPWQGRNPFQPQKQRQMEADVERLAAEWDPLAGLEPPVMFEALLHACLWGNRTDLSHFTIAQRGPGVTARDERHLILIDHTAEVAAWLARGVAQVDFINDNVGADLLFDLVLADFLLQQGWVRAITFHLKDRPFFVSDAMPEDAQATVALLQAAVHPALKRLGGRLAEHLAASRLVFATDPFWATCLMHGQMPPHLRAKLAHSALVILKGDVNYRRLLDDAHWPHTARMEDITGYFPAPFVTLRTLKSEIMVGLPPGRAEALAVEDPAWLTNGKYGVIQLVARRQPRPPV
jgi:hypothetical protein